MPNLQEIQAKLCLEENITFAQNPHEKKPQQLLK